MKIITEMPPRHRNIHRQLLRLLSPRNNPTRTHLLRNFHSSVSSFASPDALSESPDLPAWLRESPTPRGGGEDDDFVIPPLANWVHNPASRPHKNLPLPLLLRETDSGIDVVCETLLKCSLSVDGAVTALDGCGVEPSVGLISQLLKRFGNDWSSALAVFTWAKRRAGYVHTPELYDSMVDVLGKYRQFSLMWDLVQEMGRFNGYVTLVTMSKVMRRLAKARMYNEVMDVFRTIEKYGLRKDVEGLIVLMDALVKEGSVEHAREAFDESKNNVELNLASFNVLVHGYCKARMFDEARRVMEEMKPFGLSPNVVSYTCLVESYCKMKDFRNVEAVLIEMQENGCKPSVITYTIIAHAFGKAKQINEVLKVYETMKREGCAPDTSFYNSFIFTLLQLGRFKDACEVFEDMEVQSVARDAVTYSTMISAACAHSQEENALKLLLRMEDDMCKPDLRNYLPLLQMSCRMKRMKVLKYLLIHMFENNVSIDFTTYSILVGRLCQSGKLNHSAFFFSEMVSKGMLPRNDTYKMLVQEFEQRKMVELKEKIEVLMSEAKERNGIGLTGDVHIT